MSLRFYCDDNNRLIMEFFPEFGNVKSFIETVRKKTNEGKMYLFKKTFNITFENFIFPEDFGINDIYESVDILIGNYNPEDGYNYLDKNVFDIDYNFAFDDSFVLYSKYITKDGVSLIKVLSRLINNDIFIDSNKTIIDADNHISLNNFKDLISRIPTKHELELYSLSSIQNIVEDFFEVKPDYKTKYESYVKRRRQEKLYNEDYSKDYNFYKVEEYRSIHSELISLLRDDSIPELTWQNKIVDIIRAIYPKYIVVIPQFEFVSLGKKKKPDFLAIDSDGNVDVIEIKKASIGKILKKYRDNYVPKSELSGAIVQTEQYTYLLKSEKLRIERLIKEKYSNLMGTLEINIVNPQGIIIAGRSDYMNKNEKEDFEVIKRMHKNIAEILTYDNLLKRLDNLIGIFSFKANK